MIDKKDRVAVSATKGGVGKTWDTEALALYAAQCLNEPTILLDFDFSNCNLSKKNLKMEVEYTEGEGSKPPIHPSYDPNNPEHVAWDGRSSTANIFLDQPVIPYPTLIKNLDILPAHSSLLNQVEGIGASLVSERIDKKLADWIQTAECLSKYKRIFIDTPPVKYKTAKAIISLATHLVIPTIFEPLPVEGVFGMLQMWNQVNMKRTKDNPLTLIGIIGNLYRKNLTIHKEYRKNLEKNAATSAYLMPFQIDQAGIFAECDHNRLYGNGKTIFDYPKSNKSRQQVEKFCHYVFERLTK